MFSFLATNVKSSYKKLAYDFSFRDLDGSTIKLSDFKNNVLVLEVDNKGLLLSKQFYNMDDMKKIQFDESITKMNQTRKSFIYNFLYSVRQKIDDPLGKKRIKN